jgi:hypothetical protein
MKAGQAALRTSETLLATINEESRRCYFIQETVKDEEGEYIPCVAVEGEKGYYKTDWHWGKDRELAEHCCEVKNAGLGVKKMDAYQIVMSTF